MVELDRVAFAADREWISRLENSITHRERHRNGGVKQYRESEDESLPRTDRENEPMMQSQSYSAGLISAAALAFIALVALSRVNAMPVAYHVDPAKSRVTIAVGKAGALSFIAGHTHEVSGPIESGTVDLDPDDPSRSHVRLVIAASALEISGADEPPDDRPKVQQAMQSDKVLDVARHRRITFESTGITTKRRTGAALDLVVAGRLTIRDVTQPVTAPVHVEVANGQLIASGRFAIKQTAFGIEPISVGGVVAVKDTLDIAFSIAARP